ncbi:MAG: hypothetical protein N838_06575 [Thiohalocapsa sp. PB-PSB1]|nr:MAG: hypothetical protein N838_06575 [Thiohalocapsa sp. PB-PSB1]
MNDVTAERELLADRQVEKQVDFQRIGVDGLIAADTDGGP